MTGREDCGSGLCCQQVFSSLNWLGHCQLCNLSKCMVLGDCTVSEHAGDSLWWLLSGPGVFMCILSCWF